MSGKQAIAYCSSINKKINSNLVYEIFISVLALIAVFISIADSNVYIKAINNVILAIFTIDYIARLAFANNRKKFFKNNILDLVAIIPFSSLFRVFRVVRLIRVIKLTKAIKFLRIFTFSKKFHDNIKSFLSTNGFIYVIYITLSIIGLGSVLLYLAEKGHLIQTFNDAVWLSFCSTTLFGYEGIEHMTIAGKIISGVLIVIGILFTGIFTATTVTFFTNKKKTKKHQEFKEKNIDVSDLSEKQFEEVLSYIKYLRAKGE